MLWGEHGKGMRSEYAPEFFGPLYPRMQEIKAAFDPNDQLNPGKIAAPPGRDLLRIDGVPTRGQLDRRIPLAVRRVNEDSLHCNGNAACFNYDPDDAMCPSWKATRRAEAFAQGPCFADAGVASAVGRSQRRSGGRIGSPSETQRVEHLDRSSPTRPEHLAARRGTGDFSLEVKEAMDGCLACKSCVGQCPIKVDVPAFRSRFLEVYHGRYLRPAKDGLVASLERALPLAGSGAPPDQWPDRQRRLGARRCDGSDWLSLPELSAIDLQAVLKQRGVADRIGRGLRALSDRTRDKSVIVVQDAFTSYYDTGLVLDFCELLQRLGFMPWLAPFKPNGKPQHVLGFLGAFERTAAANADMLNALAQRASRWWVSIRR